ncbi:MAG: prepilin-type N-terminal cleavage/methylation domain-containing protein [Acidobacteriota bacterium]
MSDDRNPKLTRAVGLAKSRWENQSGFTMIEMMVASMILLIGVLSVASLIGSAVSTNAVAKYDTIALSAAEMVMDDLKGRQYSTLADGGYTLTNGLISFSTTPITAYTSTVSLADSNNIGNTMNFEVRWSISTVATGTGANGIKRIVVAARRAGGNWKSNYPPVQISFLKAS